MLKFSFWREKQREFKHLTHGLIPAASIAPKAAVPLTPPPRSPNPSPERHRSALAAAILSSSLTGQTWALPPARPRSFPEVDRSETFISEPNISPALYNRDRWSEDFATRPCLSSPDLSEEELEVKEGEEQDEEGENEEHGEEHVCQSLDRLDNCSDSDPLYTLPLKPETCTTKMTPMFGRRLSSPDLTEGNTIQSPKHDTVPLKKRVSAKRCSRHQKDDVPSKMSGQTTNQCSQGKDPKRHTQPPPETSMTFNAEQRDTVQGKTKMEDEQRRLEERLQRLELNQSQASSKPRSPAGSMAELQNLRRHAQELVDENDALKMTVHRLNSELSLYQTRFRKLSKHEASRITVLPNMGPPPPLQDMKYLSPLILAYEDRIAEKDALRQNTEEEMKRLRDHVQEVIEENESLNDRIAKTEGISQKDCHQLQQQAFLVLQENQVLIDQLEAQHAKAKANYSKHHTEVSKVSKQLMLLEAEKQKLQEEQEDTKRELQKKTGELQTLQAHLKDAVTWDEHCDIAGKLRRQLEQLEATSKAEANDLLLRVSSLQEENRRLALDKADLTTDARKLRVELELTQKAKRRFERKMSILRQQKEDSVAKEEKTRHYLGAVVSVADHISQERDQLLHMASVLQQEKEGFINRILDGTVRFGKLQEEVKVYRRKATTRLAAVEEAAEGRTASYQREIFHLQRLLRERREAEERLLQSKRDLEDELESVWQAVTGENHRTKGARLDSRLSRDTNGWALKQTAFISTEDRPHSSPSLQKLQRSDSDQQNNSLDEKQKHGLDFYC